MNLKKIQDADLNNKRVLVRVDFNVSIEDERVRERFKIEACQETIKYLIEKNAKIALVTHLGRPLGKVDFDLSLERVMKDIENILGITMRFNPNCVGEEVRKEMDNLAYGEVVLLENVRFHEGEHNNDEEFAEALAEGFDIFINEAFGVCHRNHASVVGVTEIIPSYAGFCVQREVENLEKIMENPEHPATAIIGGAKIETKLPLIKNFEKNYDHILVGGIVACEAIDNNMEFSDKVVMASDFAKNRYDVGPETIKKFKEIISQSKTVIWNGPMGKFEIPPYDKGTNELLEAIVESDAFSLIGGGESVQALEASGFLDKISFVSTGGGAMLEFLGEGNLPGLESLKV